MAAKHTPGPWFVGAQNDALYVIDRRPRPSNDDINPDHDVCVIAKTYSQGRASGCEEANALLIAAAPLMREALLAVRAACRDPDTDTALPSAVGEAVEAALAAMGERS